MRRFLYTVTTFDPFAGAFVVVVRVANIMVVNLVLRAWTGCKATPPLESIHDLGR
jgi:hypothetical protein